MEKILNVIYAHLYWYLSDMLSIINILGSVQSLSHVQLFATPWAAVHQASLSITNCWSLPKLMSIELVMPSNHLILCCPLLLQPSIFPSNRVLNESALCIRWPKYWSFSFNISPSNEHPGLIFFRMDWLDLLAVQGTLKSLGLDKHKWKLPVLYSEWVDLTTYLSTNFLCYFKIYASYLCVSFCRINIIINLSQN